MLMGPGVMTGHITLLAVRILKRYLLLKEKYAPAWDVVWEEKRKLLSEHHRIGAIKNHYYENGKESPFAVLLVMSMLEEKSYSNHGEVSDGIRKTIKEKYYSNLSAEWHDTSTLAAGKAILLVGPDSVPWGYRVKMRQADGNDGIIRTIPLLAGIPPSGDVACAFIQLFLEELDPTIKPATYFELHVQDAKTLRRPRIRKKVSDLNIVTVDQESIALNTLKINCIEQGIIEKKMEAILKLFPSNEKLLLSTMLELLTDESRCFSPKRVTEAFTHLQGNEIVVIKNYLRLGAIKPEYSQMSKVIKKAKKIGYIQVALPLFKFEGEFPQIKQACNLYFERMLPEVIIAVHKESKRKHYDTKPKHNRKKRQ